MLASNIQRDQQGRLCFAGQRIEKLAHEYGTPLYLMDEDRIRLNCRMYLNAFRESFGENALPLYGYLKSQKGFEGFNDHPFKDLLEKEFAKQDAEWDKKPDIKWNFTKFIIDRDGNVVARFEPTAYMGDVEDCIVSLL